MLYVRCPLPVFKLSIIKTEVLDYNALQNMQRSLNYAESNNGRHYEVDNGKFVSRSSRIIECIVYWKAMIVFRQRPSHTSIKTRCESKEEKVHFHKYPQLFMRDCNRAFAVEMSTISWLERNFVLQRRHSLVVNTAIWICRCCCVHLVRYGNLKQNFVIKYFLFRPLNIAEFSYWNENRS